MRKLVLCPWCIQGLKSHGENIYVGDYSEKPCEECGEEVPSEERRECIWEGADSR